MAWELLKTEDALASFSPTSADLLPPCLHSFTSLLLHCRKARNLSFADRAYAIACSIGVESESAVKNHLVPMFVDCGSLHFARQIFRKSEAWSQRTWSSLVAGSIDQGDLGAALRLYDDMETVFRSSSSSSSMSKHAFLSLLKASAKMKRLDRGRSLHASIAMEGLELDPFLATALVDMYGKCGSACEAQDVFDSLPEQDVVCWTALITAYAQQRGFGEKARRALERMQAAAGICPDVALWNAVLLAYAEHGEHDLALGRFAQMQEQGALPNPVTYLNVLRACSNRAAVRIGARIHARIHEIARRNEGALGTALIDMYGKCGDMAEAERIFGGWPAKTKKSVVSWNSLITGHAHQGQFERVFGSLETMVAQGVRPDVVTLLIVLNVCSHGGFLDRARRYFRSMISEHGIVPTVKHYNCMVDLLGRLGSLAEALAMMEEMPYPPNYVTWSNLLGACQKWGDVELCRKAFEHALHLKVKDARVFVLMSNVYADVEKWRAPDAKHVRGALLT